MSCILSATGALGIGASGNITAAAAMCPMYCGGGGVPCVAS